MKKSVSLRPQMIGVWRSWLSALAWGARGRPFESDHPDSEKKKRHQAMSLFCCGMADYRLRQRISPQGMHN